MISAQALAATPCRLGIITSTWRADDDKGAARQTRQADAAAQYHDDRRHRACLLVTAPMR